MNEGDIISGLHMFVKGNISGSFTGEVQSVNESAGTAVVLFNELEYPVRLRSVIDGEFYLIIVPALESQVLCVPEGNSDVRFVVLANNKVSKVLYKGENITYTIDDENKIIETVIDKVKQTISVDKIETTVDQAKFNIAENKFEFSNATYGLKAAINDLITEIKAAIITTPSGAGTVSPSTIAKLEIINSKVNQLLS